MTLTTALASGSTSAGHDSAAPMTNGISPSKSRSKVPNHLLAPSNSDVRVSNFHDDASDSSEEDYEPESTFSSALNRRSGKDQRISAPGGETDTSSPLTKSKKRKDRESLPNGNGNAKEREARPVKKGGEGSAEARRKEAERLFEKRQDLPFYQGRRMILEEIMKHDTTILLGETGCGKSTQLPQLLRTHTLSTSHYFNNHGKNAAAGPSIAITQPRRLPAIALANRVAAEMGCPIGGEVGYSVRFEEMTSRDTKIRYCTEGVLMRELANPDATQKVQSQSKDDGSSSNASTVEIHDGLNLLLKYDIIILDEAHERTLNTDFLCGALKKVQRIRKELAKSGKGKAKGDGAGKEVKELKLVVMSATLDPSKFQAFFGTGRDALLVKGRMYEVTTQHVANHVDDFIEAAGRQVINIHCGPGNEGDILVFMPGSDEIENCVELLRRVGKQLPDAQKQLQVLPLYAALPPSAQAKIFSPTPKNTRRVIVATNIAETSMTIPGVAYVVDTGYKKEKEYIYRTSGAIEQLRKKGISKAAAWQRTGRAGRERAGHCYRLFTKKAFDAMPEFDAPEIQRCNLSSAVLQLIAMGQNPFDFEYIDNPGRDAIAAAFQTLAGLEAISSPTHLTDLGRQMLRFPLDPPHARILISSFSLDCTNEIIDILSLINAGGTVFLDRPSDREEASTAKAKFVHRDGDHLTALNVFRSYIALRETKLSSSHKNSTGLGQGQGVVGWCKDNFVNGKTLVQALKIRDQLRELCEKAGKDWRVSAGSESAGVLRALLSGLFMNTAVIQADGSYRQTAGSLTVKIHPSSVLMSKRVPAILYDELTITSAFYARNVSVFEQHWLTEIPMFAKAGAAMPVGKGNL
ncbi:ATP-dependent RNA helicase prh1 [Kwoniella heveanensis BCC8398]|uniref:RNA helicase n=1 Tax=Kwoniella heveanensis BCC8398 TaxID=1296120 RepID=A0A1B9GRA5_9TREE|nr:ATP-dependent RNA helicase prh1 [Kwoniella heveanensis BCC8398]